MPDKTYVLGSNSNIPRGFGQPIMTHDAISGGLAFLVSELEKLDPTLREPLTSVTYPRDIPIETGGGWVSNEANMNVDYGVSGGSGDAAFGSGAANAIRIMQANLDKDLYPTHPYEVVAQIKFIDQQRGNVTGRSIQQLYDDGIRLDFDKHMDKNSYLGYERYGSYGIVNNPNVAATSVPAGAGGTTTWKSKTPDEILSDVNYAVTMNWMASEYDTSAVANHVLIDPENYAYLVSTKVSGQADKTILTFLQDNNMAKQKGADLVICECRYCIGTGTGGTNRMIVYRNEKRFISASLLAPLSRAMTGPNIANASYDSLYVANVGQVKTHYYQPIGYFDGI